MTDVALRHATPDDAALFVRVFELASHGLAQYLWRTNAAKTGVDPGDYALANMRKRLAAQTPGSSLVAEVAGRPAGGIVTYVIDGSESVGPDTDPNIVPLIELENEAIGTRYINAVAVLPDAQGRGIGTQLIAAAEAMVGPNGTSLIVEDANPAAARLYHRLGFSQVAARPLFPQGWESDCREVRLLVKPR